MHNTGDREAELSYQALVVTESGEIALAQRSLIKPKHGELLISLLQVGVCGTDLQILRKMRQDHAKVLGHEGVGVVTAAGSDVDEPWIGRHVLFNPVDPSDQDRILGHNIDGIFQQYFLVSKTARQQGLIVPYDAVLPSMCGPLVEPLATVIYAHTLVNKKVSPRTVAVVGAGPVGIFHALYAKKCEGARVFLINQSMTRLRWAIDHNIVIDREAILDSDDSVREILNLTDGKGVDAVYLCTPRLAAPDALEKGLRYVRDGGCINLFGGFSKGDTALSLASIELSHIRRANVCGVPTEGYYQSVNVDNKTIWITGNRGSSVAHMMQAMELLKNNSHVFSSVISHLVSLREAPALLNTLRQSSGGEIEGRLYMKAVIDFTLP